MSPSAGRDIKKNVPLSFAMAGMVLTPAFLFSLKSDLPHVFMLCLLFAGAALLKRTPLRMNDRSIIYSLVVGVSLAVFMDMAIPMADNRSGILDILIKSSISAPSILYIACFGLLFRQSPGLLGVVAALSMTVMLVGGDLYRSGDLRPERIFFAGPLTNNFTRLYMFCVGVELVFVIASLRLLRVMSEKELAKGVAFARASMRGLCLLLLPLIAFGGTLVFFANERSIRDLERFFASSEFLRRSQQDKLPFPDESDISKGLPKEDPSKEREIVARVMAKAPPGLLRAKAYGVYSEGRWRKSPAPSQDLKGQRESEALACSVFDLPPSTERLSPKRKRVEVFQSEAFANNLLLIPANAKAVEIVAERLSINQDGLLEPTNWRVDSGFAAFVENIDQNAAFQNPEDAEKNAAYLESPPKLAPVLDEIAATARANAERSRLKGDAALVESVASAVRNRCQYSLEVEKPPEGVDPVENFLLKTKKGHCELFASAAVLTLRRMGIPARYATGLVCDETHPSGVYYVARLGGAHAWGEAFLRDQRKWILFEATPASAFEGFKPEWGIYESLSDWLRQTLRQTVAWLQRGYVAEAIIDLVASTALLLWAVLSSKAGTTVCALLLAAASILGVRRALRRRRLEKERPETLRKLQALFARLERRVSKKTGVERDASSTIREWAARADPACANRLLPLVDEYEALRFKSEAPSPAALEDFSSKLRDLLSQLRKSRLL